MRTRTSKHFLYKWLKEDKFAEYTLRKSYTSRLTQMILAKTWLKITGPRRLHRTAFSLRRSSFNWINRITRTYFFVFKRVKRSRAYPYINKSSRLGLNRLVNLFNVRGSRNSKGSRSRVRSTPLKLLKTLYTKTALRARGITQNRERKVLAIWGKRLGTIRYLDYKFLNQLQVVTKKRKKTKRRKFVTGFKLKPPVLQKKQIRVKRHEVRTLKNIHHLRFYNVTAPYNKLMQIARKKHVSPNANSFISFSEFKLNSALLRSGFFENAYIVDNLAKRSPFIVNGNPVSSGQVQLRLWDQISLSTKIWWYLYARMWNFISFTKVRNKNSQPTYRRKSSNYKMSFTLKRIHNKRSQRNDHPVVSHNRTRTYISFTKKYAVLTKNLQKRNRNRIVPIYKGLLSKRRTPNRLKTIKLFKRVRAAKFANKYNVIFPVSSYIELSYKLLSFIIYRLPYKSTDSNLPSSVDLINKINRVSGNFRPKSISYLRNKNKFN